MRSPFLISAIAAVLAAGSVTAQPAPGNDPLITVDEFGVGSLQAPGAGPKPVPGIFAPDPGPGGLTSALTYNLGTSGMVPGDVTILDPSNNFNSEVIRFNPGSPANGIGGSLVFYSDNVLDLADAPADTGFPTAFYTNTLGLTEVGLEGGRNGVVYTPTANQPGFIPGFNVTYNIISDVPEANPLLASLAVVAGALGFVARRSSQKKQS